MNLQKKLLLLLGMLSAAFIGGLFLYYTKNYKSFNAILQARALSHEQLIGRIIELTAQSRQLFVRDYANWDEMVSYIKKPTRRWEKINLDETFSTFKTDYLWVYDSDFRLVSAKSAVNPDKVPGFPKALLRRAFAASSSAHFFVKLPENLVEVHGATVVPSADVEHRTAARGYFLTGKVWNAEHLAQLEQHTGDRVTLVYEQLLRHQSSVLGVDRAVVLYPIRNLRGDVIANLRLVSAFPTVTMTLGFYKNNFRFLALFALSVLVLFGLLLFKWVTIPLSKIALALETGNPGEIGYLRGDNSELGKLTRLIFLFLEQKNALEREIFSHRQTSAAKERAEWSSRAKTTFLTNMSHELRTPLNAIIGFADMLRQSHLNDMQRSHVDTIRESGAILVALINDILDIAKIESGKLILHETDFSVGQQAADIVKMLEGGIRRKGLKFKYSIAPNLPPVLRGDPTRVSQIMINLLSNSVKFTHSGGIVFSVENVVPARAGMARVKIVVADTGIGISPEKQQVIFEALTQADESITREFGGSGLGLSIARGLAQKMGGTIELSSELGRGSTFTAWIELPLGSGTKPERGRAHEQSVARGDTEAALKDRRLLIVEDNAVNLKLLTIMVLGMGCEVDCCHNGPEAIEKLRANKYDIVLMDIQMPGMSGIEAASVIRRDLKCGVPIIAVTAAVMAEDRQLAAAAGMNAFITKPINQRELLSAIITCLQTG